MEKRKDIQIFCFGHKPVEYGMPDNSLVSPLQVGGNERFLELRDDDFKDNISEWNGLYAENTGVYDIWKNRCDGLKLVGNYQYRRRFQFDEDFDFDNLFRRYDLVTVFPLFMSSTVRHQYSMCHNRDDLDFCRQVVIDLYPEYSQAWEDYIEYGRYLFYSNGYVMPVENYRDYCDFLFSVFDEFRKRKGWESMEQVNAEISEEMHTGKRKSERGLSYQAQVFGFLSERLFTLWVRKNIQATRIMVLQYVKMEDTLI